MGILVCYDEFTYDVVSDYQLDFLIRSNCITGYVDSGNWIRVDNYRENSIDPRVIRATTLQDPKDRREC